MNASKNSLQTRFIKDMLLSKLHVSLATLQLTFSELQWTYKFACIKTLWKGLTVY